MTHQDPPLLAILDGPLATRADMTLESIIDHLDRLSPEQLDDFTLAQGAAGLALFYAYVSSADGGARHAARAEQWLMRAHDIAASRAARLGLFDGLAGIGWVTMHIAGELLAPVDAFLTDTTAHAEVQSDFDIVYGTAGIALHALALPASPEADSLLAVCCEQMCRRAVAFPDKPLWWNAPAPNRPSGALDLGVAHGLPGVLPVLASAARCGRLSASLRSRVCDLLEASIALLMSHAVTSDEHGVFPSQIVLGTATHGTRLGWCYGDAGIAAAILTTSSILQQPSLATLAVDLAAKSIGRVWTGIHNAPICHGSAGLAHIFARFWHATGEARFRDAARSWYEDTISRVAQELTLSISPAILTGHAGVGLVLQAGLSRIQPRWDQIFACSPAHSGQALEGNPSST